MWDLAAILEKITGGNPVFYLILFGAVAMVGYLIGAGMGFVLSGITRWKNRRNVWR